MKKNETENVMKSHDADLDEILEKLKKIILKAAKDIAECKDLLAIKTKIGITRDLIIIYSFIKDLREEARFKGELEG